MGNNFYMSDMGDMQYFLGIRVQQSSNGIFITQTKYVDDMLAKFSLIDYKLIDTYVILSCKLMEEDSTPPFNVVMYRSLVGSMIHAFFSWIPLESSEKDTLVFIRYQSFWIVV